MAVTEVSKTPLGLRCFNGRQMSDVGPNCPVRWMKQRQIWNQDGSLTTQMLQFRDCSRN